MNQAVPDFKQLITQGIPNELPVSRGSGHSANSSGNTHAPKRKDILSKEEKVLAIRNALRYFPQEWHAELATEFAAELLKHPKIDIDAKRHQGKASSRGHRATRGFCFAEIGLAGDAARRDAVFKA